MKRIVIVNDGLGPNKGESIRKGLKLTKNTLQKLALYNVKYVQAMLRNRS